MTFTAAQLDAALDELDGDDESESEGWHDRGSAYEPNPLFDAELDAESNRLYEVWRRTPGYSYGDNDPNYAAYRAHRELHKDKLDRNRSCAPKVTVNGETYDIEVVEDFGGGEGSGETRFVVIKVGGRFFRKDGYYMSYDGSHFDNELREVTPQDRTVTFYE